MTIEFRIADTFTDSLARLTGDEQKAVKTTAFDLQMDPASPGLSFHRLERVRDRNFWSLRASRDIRLIVHKTASSLLLCYVDHHNKAYQWAERRKLETHPATGAAQLVEIRETIKEITVPKVVEVDEVQPPVAAKPLLFSDMQRDALLRYGVPEEWLDDVLAADEDKLLELSGHLPAEAAEALLEIATGGQPRVVEPATPVSDPFAHPDAQRRFRVMSNIEELERALDFPWDKWTVFLHPAQRQWVERDYNGPARVSGSAGTGKTIVALHRAVWLARQHPGARVLLTTFSDTLANALRDKLARLISNEPMIGERLEVHAIDRLAARLHQAQYDSATLVLPQDIAELLNQAAARLDQQPFTARFLQAEWQEVVDAWQLQSWEDYRDVRRLGRKTRLPEQQRALLWSIFEQVRATLAERGQITQPGIFAQLAANLAERSQPLFDYAVVDEAQDIGVAQLRFLAALGGGRPNSLFFAGDLGQRIFQTPFSWRALGVDIRGRSRTLHINYRTSHQIRRYADRLLGPEVSDIDGNTEDRRGTVSAFNGPAPNITAADSIDDERDAVANWLQQCAKQGVLAEEMGVFVRSPAELERARAAVAAAGLDLLVLDDKVRSRGDKVSISTMHLAKGLEFRAVVVMACDDEVIPSQTRIDAVADEADLQEVYDTERHLLYVACTRARDHLLVIGVDPASEFLDDLEP